MSSAPRAYQETNATAHPLPPRLDAKVTTKATGRRREHGAKRGGKPKKNPGEKGDRAAVDISRLTAAERDTLIQLLEAKARDSGAKGTNLAARVTRDTVKKEPGEKPKKELSAKKLEKVEKLRQIRAEKKAAWLAKKAAENSNAVVVAPVAASAQSPARVSASSRTSIPRRLSVAAQPPGHASTSRRSSVAAHASPVRTRSASIAAPAQVHEDDIFEDIGY